MHVEWGRGRRLAELAHVIKVYNQVYNSTATKLLRRLNFFYANHHNINYVLYIKLFKKNLKCNLHCYIIVTVKS